MAWFLPLIAAAMPPPPAGPEGDASDIVIVATPLGNRDDRVPAPPAEIVLAADIDRAHALDITDYLRRMSGGVFINDVQNNPLQPDVNYRGFTASPLLGTPQGLSIYLDGVRLNQPFGDVVSWDLIPKSAIARISIVRGSDPLFGRNSLGGAIAIVTKDGAANRGFELEVSGGSWGRRTVEAQAGGSIGGGVDLFASGDWFEERGWRDASPSRAFQAFGKLRWRGANTSVSLSGSHADTDLNGNGLQEMRLLAADRASVYSQPDTTRNRAWLVNLSAAHRFSDRLSLSGTLFWRRIDTDTINGDINDDALGENVYQPNAAERAALAAAGYSGFPLDGETQANTPFPKWRCIANILLDSEPNEKCNGLQNRSRDRQREWGASGELTWEGPLAGARSRTTLGLGYVRSVVDFWQQSQFGYLTPNRSVATVTGPGAFADGSQDSENAFDARVDLNGRTATFSAYGLESLTIGKLTIDLSARYDRTAIRNRDRISPGGGTGSLDSDQVFARVNPSAAIRWRPVRGVTFDAALGQTSRAPSAVELGCADPASPCRLPNALAGDPPLKQVIATTMEAGTNLTVASFALRIGLFRTVSRDDILFVASQASGFGYFRNFGRTRRQGIDVDLSGTIGPVRVSAHYTLLDATYRSPELVDGSANSSADGVAPGFGGAIAIAKGDRIPLVPRDIFKAAIGWDVASFLTLDLDMIASSGAYARGNENNAHQPDGVYYLGPGRTAGYAVVNAGMELKPSKAVRFFLQVGNLFDKRYATAAQLAATGLDAHGNFVARPFAGPVIGGERPLQYSTFSAPGAPRSLRIGARFRF
ncbi:TonB-dependent receptor [Sphingomonas mali]|uniref:TonB-dependent receptor n=1 Tax=Sphingomonas mali TaxID=40682 RepID=UPI0009FFCC14|nr:TonB-dependent receptor [Sphingomonas mali]